jgi:hypothetical protein
MDFDKAQAEWVLGLFPAQELPELAAQAMMQGFEGPFILDLVGYAAPSLHLLKAEVVEGAFREMARPPMTKLQAVMNLARGEALKVLRKQATPWVVADAISKLVSRFSREELPQALYPFVYLHDEEEYWADRPSEFDQRVVELAWGLLEEDPPP